MEAQKFPSRGWPAPELIHRYEREWIVVFERVPMTEVGTCRVVWEESQIRLFDRGIIQ